MQSASNLFLHTAPRRWRRRRRRVEKIQPGGVKVLRTMFMQYVPIWMAAAEVRV